MLPVAQYPIPPLPQLQTLVPAATTSCQLPQSSITKLVFHQIPSAQPWVLVTPPQHWHCWISQPYLTAKHAKDISSQDLPTTSSALANSVMQIVLHTLTNTA